MTRIVDIRIVLDRDDRLRVRIDGKHVIPRGELAMALHTLARLTMPTALPTHQLDVVPSSDETSR